MAPCCGTVVLCPVPSAGVHRCVSGEASSLVPGVLLGSREYAGSRYWDRLRARTTCGGSRYTAAVCSTQRAVIVDCGMVFQSVAFNSVSLNVGRERSRAIADPVVQHWICHRRRNKEGGGVSRLRQATLTSCSWTRQATESREGQRGVGPANLGRSRSVGGDVREGPSAGVVGGRWSVELFRTGERGTGG